MRRPVTGAGDHRRMTPGRPCFVPRSGASASAAGAGSTGASGDGSVPGAGVRRARRARPRRRARRAASAEVSRRRACRAIAAVSSAVGRVGLAEQRRDPRRDRVGIAEQLEGVHAQVVPAEAAQHLGAQPQRLAQAEPGERLVGLDDDRLARVRGDERQPAAVADADPDAALLEPPSRGRRASSSGRRRRSSDSAARASVCVRMFASASTPWLWRPSSMSSGRNAETQVHRAPRAGHADGEQPVAAGLAERAEVRQQPAVRGAAVADREDHAVAALRDRLLEREHRERLGAVLRG